MRNKKIFLSVCGIVAATAPILPVITSCGNPNESSSIITDKLINDLKNEAIEEFFRITQVPRPSNDCGQIYQYLQQRIRELGFSPVSVGGIIEDHPVKEGDVRHNGLYSNLYFDIPATEGCEEYANVMLQGHMDMVRVGEGDGWKDPICAIRETIDGEDVIHTKNYLTSLGADNGIGLATMMSIAKNQTKFKHGKIRCLITADEENGMYGAEALAAFAPYVFDGYKNVINIDAEVDCGICHQSYGMAKHTYTLNNRDTTSLDSDKVYKISLHGLKGGHSGEDIGFGRANAERLIFEVLYEASQEDGTTIKLIECDHLNKEGLNTDPKTNSIISDFNLTVALTGIEPAKLKSIFEEKKKDAEGKEGWISKYRDEKWSEEGTITFDVKEITDSKPTQGFNDVISKSIVKLLGEKAMCGVVKYVDKAQNVPSTNANIGPLSLNVSKKVIETTLFSRSDVDQDMKDVGGDTVAETSEMKKYNHKLILSECGITIGDGDKALGQVKNGWHAVTKESGNKLWQALYDGFKNVAKHNPKEVSAYGGLECTIFSELHPECNIISTGAKIEHCHNQKETLYLGSLNNEYKALLYVLINANKL